MRRSRRGMTLLEVIVALTVSGVALAAGAAVVGFLSDQQVRSRSTELGTAITARQAVRDWFASADLGTAGDIRFAGIRSAPSPGAAPISEIEFVTRAPTVVAAGGDARTRVHLVLLRSPSETTAQLVAELTPWPTGTSIVLPIASDVTRFDVRFRSSAFGTVQWLDSWVSTSVLPAVVEIRISTSTQRAHPADDITRIPMTMLVGERR